MNEGFHPRRLFSYFIILAIAVVFVVNFGPGNRGCDVRRNPTQNAATVNGKNIPLEELNQAYVRQMMEMKARFGGQGVDADLLRQIVKPEKILDQLVDRELLAQAAERNGVVASDPEIRKVLYERPDFQRNGKFDYGRYTDVLRQYYRRTPASYENELRRQLSIEKLLGLVQSGAVVSEDEVKARFHKENDKGQLQFVRFLPAMFASSVSAPTPAEIDAYISGHGPQIAQLYQTNHFAYRTPEQIRVRDLLLKLDPAAPEEKKAQVKDRAAALRKEIEGGKDFAQAAREASEDTATRASGGDLGFKSREASGWAPAFSRAAFALEPGKVSEPVETPQGIHLIYLVEKKPAEDRPLDAVKKQIAEQLLRREKAQALARKAADDALKKVTAGKKLSELYAAAATPGMAFASEGKPELVDTGSFSLAEASIPKLGAAPALEEAVRKQSAPGLLPQLFPLGDGFVLAEVTQRSQPRESDFTAQRVQLYDEALQAKRMELQDAYIKSMKKTGTVTTNDQALAALASNGG